MYVFICANFNVSLKDFSKFIAYNIEGSLSCLYITKFVYIKFVLFMNAKTRNKFR